MPQSRAQRRHSRTHRDENQVAFFYFVESEAVSCYGNQLDLIAGFHVIDHAAGARFLFHEHFQVRVVRCACESEVSRLFAFNSQYGDLSRRKINVFGGPEIERTRNPRLVPNGCDNERLHRIEDGWPRSATLNRSAVPSGPTVLIRYPLA